MSKKITAELKAFVEANANHKVYFELYKSEVPSAENFLGEGSSGVSGIVQKAKKAINPDDNFIVAYAFDKVEAAPSADGKKSRKKDTKLIDQKSFSTKGILEVEKKAKAKDKAEAAEAPADAQEAQA
jgi:hypothetical protein